ncbi:AAA family ATPase [Pseudoalteromonas ruthenica]|uniref:AAA family ATPase n=1 Tax=Pseudoalteromonas ruthenica TaxID=151081 RepID=UPI00110B9729|nr:AAA family ATPase [Pseudoalteromonas ruthenica]TMP23807.1 chromosome partitioning protein ParA [Pseudoalteromonas ruthenica]
MTGKIILVGGEKGGPGKSTVAQNLAVYLINQGFDTLLYDADVQGTSKDWVDERSENPKLTQVTCVQRSGKIKDSLLDLVGKYDAIVVDAGGHDNEALRSAMAAADLMLIPLRPKRRDLKTLEHVEELVSLASNFNEKLVVRTVITQCPTLPSQTKRILDAKEACESFGLKPLNAITCNRNVYDDCDEGGLSVFECKDKKAIEEMSAIAKEFLGV